MGSDGGGGGAGDCDKKEIKPCVFEKIPKFGNPPDFVKLILFHSDIKKQVTDPHSTSEPNNTSRLMC
jgi:hypothetical protein